MNTYDAAGMETSSRKRRTRNAKPNPSKEFIDQICHFYSDTYDDREEDSAPGGLDWKPGQTAQHKSLGAFQRELADVHGIELSTSKILKILITGKRWTTERTREVGLLYEQYTEKKENGGEGLTNREAAIRIASELEISKAMDWYTFKIKLDMESGFWLEVEFI